ncbi:MAG: hypothetical protein R2941_10215 [Desulfobacterales bacterium]
MNAIQLTTLVDADGILRLQIPLAMPNQRIEVMIIAQPLYQDEKKDISKCGSGWPRGFFEATAGSFRDEPLERGDQGEYEKREMLK